MLEQFTRLIDAVMTLSESVHGHQPQLREQLVACKSRVADYRQRADRLAGG